MSVGSCITKEALDNVVQEYTAILFNLERLTANLPSKLLMSVVDSSSVNIEVAPTSPYDSHFEVEPTSPSISEQGFNKKHVVELKLDTEIEDNGALTQPSTPHSSASNDDRPSLKRSRRHLTSLEKKMRSDLQDSDNAPTVTDIGFRQRLALAFTVEQFDMAVGLVIVMNCICVMISLEYDGYLSEISLGERVDDNSWQHADFYFSFAEHTFNLIFMLEIVARVALYGRAVLLEKAVILDVLLVFSSSFQLYVLGPMQVAGFNFSFLRLLRFIKFVRVFRLVRILNLFSHLRVLMKAVLSSFQALVWSMILLLVIMIMGGMLLSEMLKDFITDAEQIMVHRKWVFKHYGTSTRAIYTLFEITLAGCWPNYIRPLIDNVSAWYVVFSLIYISVVVFAIIRIITAIFLRETMLIASNDAEMMVQEKMKQREVFRKKVESIFVACDTTGSGKFTQDEFERIMSGSTVKTWLTALELEVHDVHALFTLLEDGTGCVTFSDFLSGIVRLKGQARTMDIVEIMHASEKVLKTTTCIHNDLRKIQVQLCKAYSSECSI